MSSALAKRLGFTPHRGILAHLILVGLPLRFGLLPLGMVTWLGEPCSIFMKHQDASKMSPSFCSPVEMYALRNWGVKFLLQYQLAWVVWFAMRTSASTAVALHKLLMVFSTSTVLLMSWYQLNHPRRWATSLKRNSTKSHSPQFDQEFFTNVVFFFTLATLISIWTVMNYSKEQIESMKWSIPGNALFIGALLNIFTLIYFVEVLVGSGLQSFYQGPITTPVEICFVMTMGQAAMEASLLYRMRNFLTMPQLRRVCLYKFILNLVLPFVWFPEFDTMVKIDKRIILTLRILLILTYGCGYLFAGQFQGISRILSSEKED